MSEFYKLRRSKISDAFALVGFIIGFIVPAFQAAQHLVQGFENPGQETAGLGAFVFDVLKNALLGAALGLIVGIIVGRLWELVHREVRSTQPDSADGDAPRVAARAATASNDRPATQAGFQRASATAFADDQFGIDAPTLDASIRFDNSGFVVTDFLSLTSKVVPGDYDVARTTAALEKTVNIGAWDGERLVGAVRVLTDGYLYSTIPEVVVDPEFRRRGIGRELMRRALDLSSTGVVLLGAPPESAGFFEKLGCQRAPSGYVLRRKKAATVHVR